MSKQVNARIRNKIDSYDNWENSSFTSLKGELYIYRDEGVCALKVGDNENLVKDLPYVDLPDVNVYLTPVKKPQLDQLEFEYAAGVTHVVSLNTTETEGFNYTGTTEATEPGTYTITCTLKQGYCWTDGTTDKIPLTWQVKKLPATLEFIDYDCTDSTLNLTSLTTYLKIQASGDIVHVATNSEAITARIENSSLDQSLVITVNDDSHIDESCNLTIEISESNYHNYGALVFEINPSGIIYNDLESNTWEIIATAIHNGDRRWNVGDTKKVYLHGGNNRVSFGTSTEATVRLLGYNKDADGNYNGTADFEFVEAIVESGYNETALDDYAFTLHNYYADGNAISSKNFNGTPVYNFLNNYFINYVEEELLNVILPTTRKMTTVRSNTDIDSSTETSYNTRDTEDTNYKFTIIAPEETCFADNYPNTKDYYSVYDYYANANTDSLYKYNIFNKDEQCYCWTRYYICQCTAQNSALGDLVHHYGTAIIPELEMIKSWNANISFGIAPIFTIGLNNSIQ